MKIFFGSHPENGRHEKLFAQKVAQNFSGTFGKIRAKILCTPKNFPAATSMSGNTYFD